MKKSRKFLILCAAAVAALLAGCGKLDDVDRTTVYVDPENGVVQEAIVEEYTDEDTYSENELEAFVQEDAAAYNEEAGADSVTVSGVKVSGDEVRILLRYADSSAYAGYHLTDFFAGTLAEAQEAGYDFSGTLLDPEGEATTASDLLSGHPDYHVVIFEEPVQILTDSPVLYVSSNVVIRSETTAEVTEDNVNQEVGVVTSEKAYVIYE